MSDEDEPASKKSRCSYSLEFKHNFINLVEAPGGSVRSVASEKGVNYSTGSHWLQEKEKIKKLVADGMSTKRQRNRSVPMPKLEHKLLGFVQSGRQRDPAAPINVQSVRLAALRVKMALLQGNEIAETERAALESFEASKSWAFKFMNRNGFCRSNKKPSNDEAASSASAGASLCANTSAPTNSNIEANDNNNDCDLITQAEDVNWNYLEVDNMLRAIQAQLESDRDLLTACEKLSSIRCELLQVHRKRTKAKQQPVVECVFCGNCSKPT